MGGQGNEDWVNATGGQRKETSLDGVNYDLAYFDSIELIAPINMGFAALATKTFPATDGSGDESITVPSSSSSSSSSRTHAVGTGPGLSPPSHSFLMIAILSSPPLSLLPLLRTLLLSKSNSNPTLHLLISLYHRWIIIIVIILYPRICP